MKTNKAKAKLSPFPRITFKANSLTFFEKMTPFMKNLTSKEKSSIKKELRSGNYNLEVAWEIDTNHFTNDSEKLQFLSLNEPIALCRFLFEDEQVIFDIFEPTLEKILRKSVDEIQGGKLKVIKRSFIPMLEMMYRFELDELEDEVMEEARF